jgi:hypothetical protein
MTRRDTWPSKWCLCSPVYTGTTRHHSGNANVWIGGSVREAGLPRTELTQN